MGRAPDCLRELLYLGEGDAGGLPAGVEDLERGDLVAVLVHKPPPRLDGVASAFGCCGGVAGLDHLVSGGFVDRLLVHPAHVDDPLAQVRVCRQRRDGVVEEGASGRSDVVDRRFVD